MNDDTRKTPATFAYNKNKDGKFTLDIVVDNFDISTRCVLKGVIQRQLGIVVLEELETDMQEGTRWSDLFQATVLRVASLYTSFALRKFYLANEIGKYFSEDTITDAPNEINLPAVKVEETLRLSKAAAEVFEVTCTGMYAILTHDPEELAFEQSWMDATTQMMVNAVFDIPKIWKANINASGMVVREAQTEWVWNYSPSTEVLIIHVHDRGNKKFSQWEVTKELAIHFTGTDRENGTHYRSFINHVGGREWHVTRKVVVQRAFITALPASTTKGVFKQIKRILRDLQLLTVLESTPPMPAFRVSEWIMDGALQQAWENGYGELPVETTVELAAAYRTLVEWRDRFSDIGQWRTAVLHPQHHMPKFLMDIYLLLNPKMVKFDVLSDYLQHFEAAFEADVRQLWSYVIDAKYGTNSELRLGAGRLIESTKIFIEQRAHHLKGM